MTSFLNRRELEFTTLVYFFLLTKTALNVFLAKCLIIKAVHSLFFIFC